MRKKPSLLLLFTVILTLLFLFTACDGAGVTGPDSQSPAAPPEQTPGDETAGPASDAYPPPEEPAAEVQESQPEPYPAPGENIDAASAQPYPPPSGENATQAGEAYPAAENQSYPGPEGSTEEPGPAPNTLLGPAQSEATLTGRVWRFDQFSNPAGQTILPSLGGFESNSVEFFEDGRVIINAGCNTAQGAYAVSDGSINIQALNETQEICQGPSLGDQFLQWLNEAAAYRLQNGKLFLTLPGESGEMQLSGNNILTYADRITKILVLTAGLGLPQAQPETLEALMDTSLDELLYHEGDSPQAARGKSPGAVVLIQSPAGAMAKAAGFADVAEQKPMSTYDRLEIGSNTVMFTAVLLAQLQEEGLLYSR